MMLLRQELKEPAVYNTIITAIASGATKIGEITQKSGFNEAKQITPYLNKLINLQIIDRVIPYDESPHKSRNARYYVADNMFAYWFQYVFPNKSYIEEDLGEVLYDKVIAPDLDRFIGKPTFEKICLSYLIEQLRKLELQFMPTSWGQWWGIDKSLPKECNQVDIDIIMGDKKSGKLLLGECKWRDNFSEVEEIEKLLSRAALFPAYKEFYFYFFSKTPFSAMAIELAEQHPNLKLVTADEMF
jgi:AAA+ ATPase superfamily predicted ATPase